MYRRTAGPLVALILAGPAECCDVRQPVVTRSRLPSRQFHQELDFKAYSPTGKTMEVHIEGQAVTRAFDPTHDTVSFGAGTPMAKLQASLGFAPRRWVSHHAAHGAIRA